MSSPGPERLTNSDIADFSRHWGEVFVNEKDYDALLAERDELIRERELNGEISLEMSNSMLGLAERVEALREPLRAENERLREAARKAAEILRSLPALQLADSTPAEILEDALAAPTEGDTDVEPACYECSVGHAANRYHALGCPLFVPTSEGDTE